MKPSVLKNIHKSEVKKILLEMETSRFLSIIFYFMYILLISTLIVFLEIIIAFKLKQLIQILNSGYSTNL